MSVLATDSNGRVMPLITPGTSQDVSVTGTSAQSVALGAGTTIVRLMATTDCRLAFGSNPTAVSTGYFLPAYQEMFVPVTPSSKIAAIRNSANGTLNIVEGV